VVPLMMINANELVVSH